MIMKVWVISILLLFLIGLSVPLVMADEKEFPPITEKEKKTPVMVNYKRDPLAVVKEPLGLKVDPVEITIDNRIVARIPEDSPLFNIPTTRECLNQWPYGTIQWANCEQGEI